MKIAYLFPEELPMRRARGVQVVNTVWALTEKVEVIFFPAGFSKEAWNFYGLFPSGPKIRVCPRSIGPFKSLCLYLFQILPFLRDVDLIYLRHLKLAWWLAKTKRLHQKPVIYEAHEIFSEKTPRLYQLERNLYQNLDGLVSISQGLLKEIARLYTPPPGLPQIVLPSGTRLGIKPEEKKFLSPPKEAVFLGSFYYQWKGGALLETLGRYLPSGFKIIVYGDQKKEAPLLVFKGFLSPAKIPYTISKFQIAIFTNISSKKISKFYTSPLKLLDYMACGCAIVASDLPSVREIVSEKEALLVPPDNPQALAEGIKTLMEDKERRLALAQAAYEKAKHFTWQKRAQKLISFLTSFL